MITLRQLTRWNEWLESKTPLFFAAAYTWLLTQEASLSVGQITEAFLWILFTLCFLAYGYALNDFADREPDRKANKPNAISHWEPRRAVLFLVGLALGGPLCLLLYWSRPWVIPALLAAYFFATAYSAPPIRFKERGLAGLVVSSTAQRFFPLLVGMSVFGRFDLVSWVMAGVFSLMGLRWILVHQLGDIEADRAAGVRTFVGACGDRLSLRLMQWVVFPLELSFLLVWFTIVAREAAIVWAAALLYGLWLASMYRSRGRLPVSWVRFGELPLTDFYLIFWPLTLALAAFLSAPAAIGLIGIQLFWQRAYLTTQWRKQFRGRAIVTAP